MLWPQLVNDTLLRLAAGQTYQPRWSADILDELQRNLVPRTGTAAAERRLYRMQRAFPLAEVGGYEDLVESMSNDPKDRHVLAAAVHANVEVIVTYNLTDFPASALEPHDLSVVHPDAFLVGLLAEQPHQVLDSLHRQVEAYRKQPTTVGGLADALADRAGLTRFGHAVHQHLE